RRHEIGVRMALGAQTRDIFRLIMQQVLTLALIGIAGGVIAAVGLIRFLSSLLYGVAPMDTAIITMLSLFLIGVAVLASYIPARSASKIDPIEALRHE